MGRAWIKFLFIFIFCTQLTYAKEIKVLVLIIASDNLPVYVELQKIWRSYMHTDPEHVEAYFIKGNPDLATTHWIEGDILWSKTEEGWINTSAGIINKTVLSLEALAPRLNEFDFVLRTNLSSFYIFPRLLDFLTTVPTTRCYCGTDVTGSSGIGSGCGFILSRDLVYTLLSYRDSLINNRSGEDDLLVGWVFRDCEKVPLITHPREDFFSLTDWKRKKNHIPAHTFQCRIKNPDHLRTSADLYIQSGLLNMFYP